MNDNQRLEALVETVRRFVALDFDGAAVVGPDGDTMDALAAGINMLAEEVQAGHDDLERQIAERTVALTDAVSELEAQRDDLSLLAAVVESTTDAVITLDGVGLITSWNSAAQQTYGYSARELLGESATRLGTAGNTPAEMPGFLQRTAGTRFESPHLHKDGTTFPASVMIARLRGSTQTSTAYAMIIRDITETKQNEVLAQRVAEELAAHAADRKAMALHDALTGLGNRNLLKDRLEHALARSQWSAVTVLMIDLDDFKAVNDSVGHVGGDEVLVNVARVLSEEIRRTDTVARARSIESTVVRMGGDEFIVLLESAGEPEGAGAVAQRILDSLGRPALIAGKLIELDASIGIAVKDDPAMSAETLLARADAAMYAAKSDGKARYRFFDSQVQEQAQERAVIISELRRAICGGQLRLLYQPKVDAASGRMVGVEALVRWAHPIRGLLGPDAFIPLAEASNCIVALDDWVLLAACRQQRTWEDRGLHLQLAINVSGRSLPSGDLVDRVRAAIAATGILPQRLEIEITETAAVAQGDGIRLTLNSLRAMGITIAIDDFGMGHSALSRLQDFPVDCLKIDRFFVAPLQNDTIGHSSIAAAMLAMAHCLDLSVVAEGVETVEQLETLRTLGCETVQGFLLSRPVPPEDIEALVRLPLVLPAASPRLDLSGARPQDRLVHSLLAELQRLTGFDSTYFAKIDRRAQAQRVLSARNTAALQVPEGVILPWSDGTYRAAMERGISHEGDVPDVFGRALVEHPDAICSWAGVNTRNRSDEIVGMLCGGSARHLDLGSSALRVMTSFADLIGQALNGDPVPRSGDEFASDRDDLASVRDRAAVVRDREATGRDELSRQQDVQGGGVELARGSQRRADAAADRTHAGSDRREAAGDREEAAHQRAEAAEDRLASAEAARRAVVSLELMTDAFHSLDEGWNITYLNPQCERILGRSRAGLLGKNLWEEFPEAVNGRFYEEYHRAVNEGVNVRFTEYYEPLGRRLEVRAYPLTNGLAVYFLDVSHGADG